MADRPDESDPLDPATVACPYPFYDTLRAHAPAYRVAGHQWFKEWSDGIANLGGMADEEQLAAIQQANVQFVTKTITSGMMLLLQHPDQLQAVRDDIGLLPNLVEEVLRTESPVQCHFRRATRGTTLAGVEIPAGSGVGVLYGSANRDERQFADAARFDVRRPNARTHLAFSSGPHFCIGAPLARLEGRIAFEVLVTRLRNVRLPPDRNEFRYLPSFTHRGLEELWISYDERITG